MTTALREDWAERASAAASAACLMHCLALPLAAAAMPMLGAALFVPEGVHLWLLGFAVPMATFALLAGLKRHGRVLPMTTGAAGLATMAMAALALDGSRWEVPLTVMGGLLLIAAHAANWRLRHRTAGCVDDVQ